MATNDSGPDADTGPISTGFRDGRNRARVMVPPGTIAPFGYLTPQDQFGDVERGNPLPYTLAPDQRRAVGLERETWQLEVVADPESDTKITQLDWQDAEILAPPELWGGGLPGGQLPPVPLQFDPATGLPRQWPLRYTVAHWSAVLRGLAPGTYTLRCRTVDTNGIAQPMPRPFPKSGRVAIHEVPLVVEE